MRDLIEILFALLLAAVASGALAQPAAVTRPATTAKAISVDRVVAIVNDEAITQHDIDDAKRVVLSQMKQQNVQPPVGDVLDKQVLERLITERSLLQFAKETGLRVDDTQIERAMQRIAQDNKLSPEDFRKALAAENITYDKYREDIRSELVMQRLREREVDSHLTVSDTEVEQYLSTLKAQNAGDGEYEIAHILVLVPEQASADQIEAKRRRAEEALRAVKSGGDFGQVAAGFSDASDALRGGNLGWRAGARLPTVFADQVRKMKPGEVSPVLRSASGFHIVKLIDKRGKNDTLVVDQTHARHILIRVNELNSEADAKTKIDRLKDRLDSGAKFDELARLNSEDGSASKGGDLGWLNPGDTVGEFQDAMNKLAIGQISAPVRSSFGWHIIEVLERRKQDVTAERERAEAQLAIKQRKADEAFQAWVREVRDRAYVEIRLDDK
ncbi:MAG TPA: peptidylprolyl isomerase, partial [Casimicrobiaceae bacterium]|jgi:peptidyl-prolyl cis-trans isomerase SurA